MDFDLKLINWTPLVQTVIMINPHLILRGLHEALWACFTASILLQTNHTFNSRFICRQKKPEKQHHFFVSFLHVLSLYTRIYGLLIARHCISLKWKGTFWLEIKFTSLCLGFECVIHHRIKIPCQRGNWAAHINEAYGQKKEFRKTLGFYQGKSTILWAVLTRMFGGHLNSVDQMVFRNCGWIFPASGEFWLQ